MDFIMSDAFFTSSKLCKAIAEAAKAYELQPIEAMITTSWEGNQGIIRAYAHDFGSTKAKDAIDSINVSTDTKPVTTEKRGSTDIDARQYFSLSSYFEKNVANPLVAQERVYLEQRGYDIDEGYYFVIPFQSEVSPNALVFLIAHDQKEAENFKKGMGIIKAIKNH